MGFSRKSLVMNSRTAGVPPESKFRRMVKMKRAMKRSVRRNRGERA
jgi:hypothetical protein